MCKTPVASDLSVVESQPARILVVGSLNPLGVGDDLKGLLLEFSNVAFASVRRSDGQLHFIEASTPDRTPELALDGMDGLLILGGADADPMCYGQPRQAQTMYGINPVADRFVWDEDVAKPDVGRLVLDLGKAGESEDDPVGEEDGLVGLLLDRPPGPEVAKAPVGDLDDELVGNAAEDQRHGSFRMPSRSAGSSLCLRRLRDPLEFRAEIQSRR